MKKLFLFVILGVMSMASANSWDKVFAKSEKVEVLKVEFVNRYGIKLVGDLYIPKDMKKDAKLPAIAVAGAFGAVKEQTSGYYAQTLAQNGFIALAFDPSYTGESGGEPRHVASPDISTEDFSSAVDFLVNHKNVNPEKIGVLGICGFGGFALNVASMDTRVKATVTSTMYDMSRVNAYGYNDSIDENARYEMKVALNNQRSEDFKNLQNGGGYAKGAGLPDKLSGSEPLFVREYYEFYKTKKGFHPRSINSNGNWNATSSLSFINQPLLAFSNEIKSAVLMIHGNKAHSLYFSQDAFKKLNGENKELFIVKDANHTDMYYDSGKIPFGKIVEFYNKYL